MKVVKCLPSPCTTHCLLCFSTFCMLDEAETCLPVNVYNLAQGSGVKIGDTVAIPEPFIQHIRVKHNGKVRHWLL